MKQLKRHISKRQSNSEDHILPLINVVFLLLIFFMIAGRLTTSDPFRIDPSKSISTTRENAQSAIIHINQDNELAFQNQVVGKEALKAKLAQYLQDNPDALLRLKVDSSYPAHQLLSLLADFQKLGIEKVALITQQDIPQ